MVLFDEFLRGHFFSLPGLIAVILIVIPNLLFMRKAQETKPDDLDTASIKVSRMEFWSRLMLNFALPLLGYNHLGNYWLYAAIVILVLYYIVWIRFAVQGCFYPDIYLKNFLGIPLPVDILNVMYFIVVSIWLCNFFALVLSVDYGVCRMISAHKAYKDLSTRTYID
ncbi:MAG: hypothetical protein IKX81_05380 [Firmicutes bacterium]|nr:hypothetical protein [Bacillota bacterium]